MKAWGNLPFSLRRENTENAVANATRVHPWDVKNKTGSRVQTIPRDIPSSTDVPVLLLNHSTVNYYSPGVGPFPFVGLALSWDKLGIFLELQLTLCFYLDHSSISATRPTFIT